MSISEAAAKDAEIRKWQARAENWEDLYDKANADKAELVEALKEAKECLQYIESVGGCGYTIHAKVRHTLAALKKVGAEHEKGQPGCWPIHSV